MSLKEVSSVSIILAHSIAQNPYPLGGLFVKLMELLGWRFIV